jgi:hypothetical protein
VPLVRMIEQLPFIILRETKERNLLNTVTHPFGFVGAKVG